MAPTNLLSNEQTFLPDNETPLVATGNQSQATLFFLLFLQKLLGPQKNVLTPKTNSPQALLQRHRRSLDDDDVIVRNRRNANDDVTMHPFMSGAPQWKVLSLRDGTLLRVSKGGRVGSTRDRGDMDTILEVISTAKGLYFRGVNSGLFIVMDNRGKLRGKKTPSVMGKFREEINGSYSLFSAIRKNPLKRKCYLSLGGRKGCRSHGNLRSFRFLPIRIRVGDYPENSFHGDMY